jgi:hypothetical protein
MIGLIGVILGLSYVIILIVSTLLYFISKHMIKNNDNNKGKIKNQIAFNLYNEINWDNWKQDKEFENCKDEYFTVNEVLFCKIQHIKIDVSDPQHLATLDSLEEVLKLINIEKLIL